MKQTPYICCVLLESYLVSVIVVFSGTPEEGRNDESDFVFLEG